VYETRLTPEQMEKQKIRESVAEMTTTLGEAIKRDLELSSSQKWTLMNNPEASVVTSIKGRFMPTALLETLLQDRSCINEVSTLLFTVVRRERDMIPYFRESSLSQNRK
jgi:hypothetical protein